MKSRGTATDKLADVVQVLQIARKTGVLTVTRDGMDGSSEQGQIVLQNGQITGADVGSLRGNEAFKKLITWKTCYFIFLTSPSSVPMSNGMAKGYKHEKALSNDLVPAQQGIPYRVQQVNEVLPHFSSLGLTRAHRQLFLLIDGQRTTTKLMQLMGTRLDEIEVMLVDLERACLIRR
jgi:hypothetical protein